METSIASLHAAESEEVKPYKIHVSSKYLDLTKKKLELTRLPHEVLLQREREWEYGTPKGEIEPLIDFWLEHYTWRNRENHLNTTIPQFRTALSFSSTPSSPPLRIHFLHLKSPHKHAVPLLLLPTFPLTNLSLTPLFSPLTTPSSPTSSQPFHLIIPSLPGLGFSDPFQCSDSLLRKTAGLCDALMQRLGYAAYLASATGAGRDSPAGIDYHLLRILGEEYAESCLGVHLIEPCVAAPTLRKEPVGWMKFTVAKFFHAGIWGYQKGDFLAILEEQRVKAGQKAGTGREESPLLSRRAVPGYGAVGMVGLREPNTFAYALCDSPVGLLSLVCSALRRKNPTHTLTDTEIIDVTQLAWLPGPEAGARFWAAAVNEVAALERWPEKRKRRSRVAVTVFGSDGDAGEGGYVCPAWAGSRHDVVFSQRVSGRPRIAAWDRVDVLVNGIRELAREVDAVDGRLKVAALEEIAVFEEPIPEVTEGEGEASGIGMQLDAESPDTIVNVNVRG